MAIRRKWQRGAADLISVAVGLVILSIVTAGTSAAMIYGREALIRQEHYKTAAFILRGKVEEVQNALQTIPLSRDSIAAASYVGHRAVLGPYPLDQRGDRPIGVEVVQMYVTRDPVRRINNTPGSGYFVTMHANWRERDMAEDRTQNIQSRSITFQTAVICQNEL